MVVEDLSNTYTKEVSKLATFSEQCATLLYMEKRIYIKKLTNSIIILIKIKFELLTLFVSE